jgi:ATP-binding cassette, subfamily B, bacterial PglK
VAALRNLLETFRLLRSVIGSERRWRWVLLTGLALTVTAFEVVAALLVVVLLGLTTGGVPDVSLPLLGPLDALVPSGDRDQLVLVVSSVVGVFFVVRFVVLVARTYLQQRLTINAGALLADELLRQYLDLPYLEHTRRSTAELTRNVFDTTQQVVNHALRPMVDVVAESIIVIGLLAVLVITSPVALGLAVLVLGPMVWLLQRAIQPRIKGYGSLMQVMRKRSLRLIQQSLGGIREIKLTRSQGTFADAHLDTRLQQARAGYMTRTMMSVPRALLETALILTIVVVLIVAVLGGDAVEQVVPTLGLFAYVGLRLQPSLQRIVEGMNDLGFATAALEDLSADLIPGRRARLDALEQRVPPTAPAEPWQELALAEVTFAYRDAEHPALRAVDLTIRRGGFLGICGPTGGGKSTLVDVIIGLLDPDDGTVELDGVALAEVRTAWWDRLGVVPQKPFLMDASVRANICFGIATEAVDEDQLRLAVQRAQLEEVVESLPHGLDTRIGDDGIQLSGGQRQRVAIARALYRSPDVLVFDEGTSSLDGVTEAAVVRAIEDVQQDHTLIAVAHRISTVRAADRILVIADGRIADQGTHDELLASSHLFRALAR